MEAAGRKPSGYELIGFLNIVLRNRTARAVPLSGGIEA